MSKWGQFTSLSVPISVYEAPSGTTRALLLDDLEYIDRHGTSFVAPKGFDTDGASIPRAVQLVCGHPFEADNLLPAIIHDYCRWAFRLTGRPSLATGDRVFYHALRSVGKNPFAARIMYLGVRIGGRFKP